VRVWRGRQKPTHANTRVPPGSAWRGGTTATGEETMRFISKVSPLADAVAAAAKIINTKGVIPILANVMIIAEEDVVIVRSTDLETTYERRVPAAVTEAGRTTLQAHVFSKYLSQLEGEDLTLDATLGTPNAFLGCGKSRVELPTMTAEEYPELPTGEREMLRSMDGKYLARALDSVIFCAATDGGAQVQGLRLDIGEDGLKTTATDGYRLARHDGGLVGDMTSLVMTATSAKMLARGFQQSPQVTLSLLGADDNHLVVDDGRTKIHVRLVAKNYPDLDRVIEAPSTNSIVAPREDLRLALKRAAMLADSNTRSVLVNLAPEGIGLHVESQTYGIGEETIIARGDGAQVELHANAAYLAQILDQIETDNVIIDVDDNAGAPIHITPDEPDAQEHYVLMPLRG